MNPEAHIWTVKDSLNALRLLAFLLELRDPSLAHGVLDPGPPG